MKRNFNVKLEPSMIQHIKEIALVEGRSMAAVVRIIISDELSRIEVRRIEKLQEA